MINGKKIIVVMPAYNASQTLERTYTEIPHNIVDQVILVDDCSSDDTAILAKKIGIEIVIQHDTNKGYGGNQKTCYTIALEQKADIIVMLHPDYQYTPLLLEAMVYPIANGLFDVMMGSRILGKGARAGGMPTYKYIANRFLTLFQNILMNQKLSEYHSGYRAYSKEVLSTISFQNNSDDFVFDNELLGQITFAKFNIGEVTCPTKYFAEASSINFKRSVTYGLGVVRVSCSYRIHKWGLWKFKIFQK